MRKRKISLNLVDWPVDIDKQKRIRAFAKREEVEIKLPHDRPLGLRFNEGDIGRWKKAAKRAGKNLTEWIGKVLNDYCDEEDTK